MQNSSMDRWIPDRIPYACSSYPGFSLHAVHYTGEQEDRGWHVHLDAYWPETLTRSDVWVVNNRFLAPLSLKEERMVKEVVLKWETMRNKLEKQSGGVLCVNARI